MSVKFLIAATALFASQCLQAAPQQLLNIPLESPDLKYSVNVEWDAAGFIGRIRMLINTQGEAGTGIVELPQIKPSPANLSWITNEWVACESFVAESGAAYFYVDVTREKGYMIEIFAPEKEGDWLISFTTNDSVSSDTIHGLSKGHSSLFPILLRNLPEDGLSYLSPDFPYLLADAVDSFVDWRKRENFSEIKFLTDVAENPNTGRLVLASVDNRAEIVYFPQGTTTTREMLTLTQRQPLPDSVQKIISGVDPPRLKIEWTDDIGQFRVMGSWEDDASTTTELVTGRFEGVSDTIYTGPGVQELLKDEKPKEAKGDDKAEDKEKPSVKKTSSKESSKSKSKKPSRSN